MRKTLLLVTTIILFASCFTLAQTTWYYLGTGTTADQQGTSCASCHTANNIGQPIYDEFKNTKHAIAQDSLVNTLSYSCLPCHNTGWDLTKTNYGADEYVVKDTTQAHGYRITNATLFGRVKNVGCEACHGPAGDASRNIGMIHWTNYQPSYSSTNCGSCHDGSHHPYYTEWVASAHSHTADFAFVNSNKTCVRCHIAQNFIAYAKNPETYRDTILVTGTDIQPLTCQSCHDPHSDANPGQLRFPLNSTTSICDHCHNGEVDSIDVNTEPHHATSEVLSGTNFGFKYPGQTYINSAHTFAVPNRCVTCHIVTVPAQGLIAGSTGHTFEPKPKVCATCHADYYSVVDTSNHAKQFDYRGMQTKTDSLLAVLNAKLKASNHSDSSTLAFKRANYNYLSVVSEGSRGIHNTRLVQKLLVDAIANYNPSTGVNPEVGNPNTFELSQNYPNPFNPTTVIRFTIPQASNVKITVFDALGKEITVLVNGTFNGGTYKVDWNASQYSSGIYFYRIEAGSFNAVKKMILMK